MERSCCCDKRHVSERESALLVMVARGTSDERIARELCLSSSTVRGSITALRAKLAAGSRAELIAKAYVLGLLVVSAWPPAEALSRCYYDFPG